MQQPAIRRVSFFLIALFLTLTDVDASTCSISLTTRLRKLDLPAVVILIAAVSCLILASQEGGAKVPWSSSKPIGLLVGFSALKIDFPAWQWKTKENAMIPIQFFFTNRTVLLDSRYLFSHNMTSYHVSVIKVILKVPSASSFVDHLLGTVYDQAALVNSHLRSGISYTSLAVP